MTPKKTVVKKVVKKKATRRIVNFNEMVKRVSARFGNQAALSWTKAVTKFEKGISEAALRSAIASRSVAKIEAAIRPTALQRAVELSMIEPLAGAVRAAGSGSAQMLRAAGLEIQFNAAHPNVALYARQQAARLVVGVAKETKAIIAEVIARGAERGLTVVQQARAIREVIGLPPNWANAPTALGDELRAGEISSATSRKLSARLKQQIRSAAKNDKMTEEFIAKVTKEYGETLIYHRAQTIARTETLRASHYGLEESWNQAKQDGLLPTTTRQTWIVTPDDRLCPICNRIPGMNPEGRRLGESFMTPEGLVDYPPAPHPNCRCSVGLIFVVE